MREDSTSISSNSFLLRLHRFRAFEDSGNCRIAPLTCLVGRNSSGKSSILTALLLLKQSIDRISMGAKTTPLALHGQYCDLGNYYDVVYGHDEEKHIGFDFTLPMSALQTLVHPRSGPIVRLDLPENVSGRRSPSRFRLQERLTKLPAQGNISVSLEFKTDEPFGPSLSRLEIKAAGIGSVNFVRTEGEERKVHWRAYAIELPARSIEVTFSGYSFFPFVSQRQSSYRAAAPRTKERINRFVTATRALFELLGSMLGKIEHVGPFRTPPERRYIFSGFAASRSGTTGEQAVELLIAETLLKAPKDRTLNRAVSFWLAHLGLAKRLSIESIAKQSNLFELTLYRAGVFTTANFADVGFGISQILPVLVQGMLMSPGSIYIVQQPELHLHPDAQAALVDFFIYLNAHGVTTLVETHSEYFLVRLRRRLAEGVRPLTLGIPSETKWTSKALSVDAVSVLLTRTERNHGASVSELHIGQGFQFENLPAGFMNQSVEDRLHLLKALRKH